MTNGLTIITPSFDSARFLQQCLDSVSACRTVTRHIVMDGGSRDGTVEILERHQAIDPRLIWISEPDRGQSHALNKALALVDTDYFGWLNADDIYASHAIDSAFRRQSQSTEHCTAIVYGNYNLIDETGTTIGYRQQPSFCFSDCLFSYLTVLNSSALFRTDRAREVGGFDESLQFAMDYDLVLRMAAEGAVRHSGLCLSAFRLHQAAKTSRLQHVYRDEIWKVRRRYTTLPHTLQRAASLASRARVLARMAREGCLHSRIRERLGIVASHA